MSAGGVSLAVIVGSLFVLAIVWIAVTRHPSRPSAPESEPEPIVGWRRPLGRQIAHAFRMAELRVERFDAEALAFCGRWPVAHLVAVAELVADDDAPHCAACARALARMDGGTRPGISAGAPVQPS